MAEQHRKKQCPASFKTPDGRQWYCQRREGHPSDPASTLAPREMAGHRFNAIGHPVTWSGSAEDLTPFCGDARCPGGATPLHVPVQQLLNVLERKLPPDEFAKLAAGQLKPLIERYAPTPPASTSATEAA